MSTLAPENPRAWRVSFTEDELVLTLVDGRVLHVPLEWYPRLRDASPAELANFRLLGDGEGIHWPDLDEDLSVRSMLMPVVPTAGPRPVRVPTQEAVFHVSEIDGQPGIIDTFPPSGPGSRPPGSNGHPS